MEKIPYGKQSINEKDIEAVIATLCSDWLTTGPKVNEFEDVVCEYVGASNGVAVSSGTAALHCAMYAIGISSGDEVIVPAMTFAATANSIIFQGGIPVFADVDEKTLLIDVEHAKSLITSRTKAIVAVDYAGQTCNYEALRKLTERNGLILIADACHSLGAQYNDINVGTLADITVFSFHPVKHITTGEGGMAVTNCSGYAQKMRLFRNHGITSDLHQREKNVSWHYEMVDLGFNYRISDFQCALGISQMQRLPAFLQRRRNIAHIYSNAFSKNIEIIPLSILPANDHSWHLYVVKLSGRLSDREKVFKLMRSAGIGVNVHYIPVHIHPYYRSRFGNRVGSCPVAEKVYRNILSLPIWPGMEDCDVHKVINTLDNVVQILNDNNNLTIGS